MFSYKGELYGYPLKKLMKNYELPRLLYNVVFHHIGYLSTTDEIFRIQFQHSYLASDKNCFLAK